MRNNGRWPGADRLTLEGGKLWMYKQDGYTEGGLGVAASNLGNAQAGHVLSGVSASSANGLGFGGSMPNRSGWSATIAPGGYVSVPAGYHNGATGVSARGININDITSLIKVQNVPTPTASIYRPNQYILGPVEIGEAMGAVGAKRYMTLSSDHHTLTFNDGTPAWFNYAYIQL